ncbi:MAG TPA: bifunctional 5,10-methylenetetrahydrofolate dehydrogenase/5,10-methenyltetrahydrofolate cyclohydrolase [Actinomycetota bacterium]|nr:bifunctional 5,10-methylenetetrahydrofolate dehydrogenase/5,10-methenyltetrahydrofolate cyclohydrolase [Actinomycetota bacterium]
MTAALIDGKATAAAVRQELAGKVAALASDGIVPGLAAVLVGEDPASAVYVAGKERDATAVGMASFVHRLPAGTVQAELLDLLARLNADPAVHGIIVQMPLPGHLDTAAAQEAVDPAKDVDGLHPDNAGLLALGRPRFIPCTPLGILVLLERAGVQVSGAHAVVVGRSALVGRPIATLLSAKGFPTLFTEGRAHNATVTLCHTGTRDLAGFTRSADILVAASGVAGGITGAMLRPGVTVIDVGITRTASGALVGDVDFASASEVAGKITPVPGGVGPMTRAMLLANTVQAAAKSPVL